MHYSESWREKYLNELANGEWLKWNDEKMNFLTKSR